jgi:hypothetical protein
MYFVFDMDETLAELYSVYYFIASLRLRETLQEARLKNKKSIPESLENQLQRAYRYFIRRVLAEELSDHPLGILRPGILDVMMELQFLRREGVLKHVLIYSNNSHLQSLEFIRDLIHEYLGTNDLIIDCIHWNHPMRDEERIVLPGFPNKTWSVLKRIMVSGNCRVHHSIQPHQVHFFDDLEHWDLKRELGANYHQVAPYTFRASFDRLSAIYRDVIKAAKVDTSQLMEYVIQLFTTQNDVIFINVDDEAESIVKTFQEKTRGTAARDQTPPLWDSGVNGMMNIAKSLHPKNDGIERRDNSPRNKSVLSIEGRGIPIGGKDHQGRRGGRFRTHRRKHYRGRSSERNRKRKRLN